MRSANLKIIKGIIKLFGRQSAIDKIQEESIELALALHQYKCITKIDKKRRLNDIYGELADMKIMMRQAEMLFSKKKINRLVNQKLQHKKNKYLTTKPKQNEQSN
jgi:predicted nucleotidyltransferase